MLLSFVSFVNSSVAQENLPDSVQKKLENVADSSKVEILRRLGHQYHDLRNYAAALSAKFEALKWAEETSNPQLLFITLYDLANYYGNNKSFASAEAFAQRAEQIALEQKDNENLYEIYDLLGGFIYFNQGKYDDAYRYGLKLLELAESSGDKVRIAYVNSYLGDVYRVQKKYSEALAIYQKALLAVRAAGDKDWERTFLNNIAVIYNAQDMNVEALEYFRDALASAIDAKDEGSMMTYSSSVAEEYLQLDSLEQAELWANKSLILAKKFKESRFIIEGLSILKRTAFSKKEFQLAYSYADQLRHLNDSLNSGKLQADLISFQARYEMGRKDREIDLLEKNNRLQSTIRNILLASSGLLLFAVFLVGRQYKISRKARHNAEQKSEELAKALKELKSTQAQLIHSEKMASLGELTTGIAHEIQNPLNFVNNFSDVNKELLVEMNDEITKGNLDQAKSIAILISENEEKINHHGKRADGIVKGMLQHSRTRSGQKELTDLNGLADEYLRLAYHGLKAKDKSFNAKLETAFDPLLPKISLVPQDIGRVILNLINNAFQTVSEKSKQQQHEYEPTVIVSTKLSIGKVEISVKDNGCGIPASIKDKIFQPFFTTKPAGQGTGLGLSLSYDTVKAHGGEISLQTKENEGTVFIVRLPV